MLVCIIIVGVVVLASAQTCKGFVIVLWVLQYYTQIVSTILGVEWQLGVSGSSGVSPRINHADWGQ